jgi:hypothetical protein
VSVLAGPSDPAAHPSRGRFSRVVWHAIGLVLAALLAYAVWRGYQNPDLLLDWGALRLC